MPEPDASFPTTEVRPFVIPVFIVHQGCPHRCLFCDQQSIAAPLAGDDWGNLLGPVGPEEVCAIIKTQLAWPRRHLEAPVQVAFYGGNFTGLPLNRQKELLDAVRPFLDKGLVREVRISTRPDAITPAIAAFLFERGVRVVELGAQSLADRVLAASRRGHNEEQIRRAFYCLRAAGFKVGLQLMIGLPGDNTATVLAGARRAAAMSPDLVRIYPCLVLAGSPLAGHFRQGSYQALSLPKAVALAVKICRIFEEMKIPVVRMGLQGSPSLEKNLLAGPFHPAFGELVLARRLFLKARSLLAARISRTNSRLILADRDRSVFCGRQGDSLARLRLLGLLEGVEMVFSSTQPRGTVRLDPPVPL